MINPHVWRLDTATSTLVLLASQEHDVPAIAWFGSSLSRGLNHDAFAQITDLPLPMAKLDTTVPLSLFPQASTGIDCQPALRGHRNGAAFAHRLCRTGVHIHANTLQVELSDQFAQLEVTIQIELQPNSNVLSVSTELRNIGDTEFTVDHLATATMPLPSGYSEALTMHGRWGLEFQTRRAEIHTTALLLENNRGRSSHESYPGLVVGEPGFSENKGDLIAAHLAWSGSHRTVVEQLSDGRRYVQTGAALNPGELILAGGESFATPTWHLTRANGMNHASQSLHRFAREHILPHWTRQARPVHANSWEALYFDHDINKLRALVDAAKSIGAERFILDDGWFPARRSDSAGLGDWTVDKSVYPQGLQPLVDHVRAAGMQFGLWFEPEMVNPDSNLYRAHPEWVLHLTPYETPLARNQLVLNLDLPEVFDYLFEHIAELVRKYNINYIKWDHNRDMVLAGDGTNSRLIGQVAACYRLMNALNEAFPLLEIESCASGGARADWGVLQHTGRVWTSDSIDAIDRARIQRGYSLFNPPEIMGAHVGHARAHLTGRDINIHTRAIVAMQGQFGYEVDAGKLSKSDTITLCYYADLYKKHRDWIAESTTWRLETPVANLICNGLVSNDKQRSFWFVLAEASLAPTTPGLLIPMGLNDDIQYIVTMASPNYGELAHFSKHMPNWLDSDVTVAGRLLMTVGLSLPIMPAQSALMLEISAV